MKPALRFSIVQGLAWIAVLGCLLSLTKFMFSRNHENYLTEPEEALWLIIVEFVVGSSVVMTFVKAREFRLILLGFVAALAALTHEYHLERSHWLGDARQTLTSPTLMTMAALLVAGGLIEVFLSRWFDKMDDPATPPSPP